MSRPAPVIAQQEVAAFLRPRPLDSHKGMFGKAVIIGGAAGIAGAALLAGRAALKLGAGAVHVLLLAEAAPAVDPAQPELMLHQASEWPLPDHATVYAAGCGLGTSMAAKRLLQAVLAHDAPLVLDADALNLLALHPDLRETLRARSAPAVITPHPAEAAGLLGTDTAAVQADRLGAATRLARELHCAVALKGAGTVCATGDGRLFVNATGNPGMSAPGMGDALTGIITALIAQGLSADEALLLGVHLHGAAGDALAQEGIALGMTAGELIDWARWLLNRWLQQRLARP